MGLAPADFIIVAGLALALNACTSVFVVPRRIVVKLFCLAVTLVMSALGSLLQVLSNILRWPLLIQRISYAVEE